MRFEENSRKGASSLIVVMFVAVIALAGTAVYVALDETVLTTDGYALPGSTITLTASGTESSSQTGIIYGYHNGTYYVGNEKGEEITDLSLDISEAYSGIPQELITTTTGTVNVPGLGNTASVTQSFNYTAANEGTIRMEYTTILHGLFYSFSSHYNNGISDETTKITMESSKIHVGDYENVPKISQTFTGSGTTTVIIQAISTSVENGYLFSLTKSGTDNIRYFDGTNDMIPVYIIQGSSVYNFADVTLNISGNDITLINWDGTYRPQTS